MKYFRRRTAAGTTVCKISNLQRDRKEKERRFRKLVEPPVFQWVQSDSPDYYAVIRTINDLYRDMLDVGNVERFYQKPMLHEAKSREEFKSLVTKMKRRYKDNKTNKVSLGIQLPVQFFPDPESGLQPQSYAERSFFEEALCFEYTCRTCNYKVCEECMENKLVDSDCIDADHNNVHVCKACKNRGNSELGYYLRKNLQPVWYETDEFGNVAIDAEGKSTVHYEVPDELSDLTMAEKLSIRRYATYVPSLHMKNGSLKLRGHCVAFPQNISEICNELPRKKDAIITMIRHICNRDNNAVTLEHLKIRKNKVLNALRWLKKHHKFYKDIHIVEENLDWVGSHRESYFEYPTTGSIEVKASKKQVNNEDEEFISRAHQVQRDDNELEIFGMHPNEPSTVPEGADAHVIKELIETANENSDKSNFINFPAINHETPVS